jgi:hypothetical protein
MCATQTLAQSDFITPPTQATLRLRETEEAEMKALITGFRLTFSSRPSFKKLSAVLLPLLLFPGEKLALADQLPGGNRPGQGCALDGQGLEIASSLRNNIPFEIRAALETQQLDQDLGTFSLNLGDITSATTTFSITGDFSLRDGRRLIFRSIDGDSGSPIAVSYYGVYRVARRDPDGRPLPGGGLRCVAVPSRSASIAIVEPGTEKVIASYLLGSIP